MQSAQDKLAKVLESVEMTTPSIPVICNYSAKQVTTLKRSSPP